METVCRLVQPFKRKHRVMEAEPVMVQIPTPVLEVPPLAADRLSTPMLFRRFERNLNRPAAGQPLPHVDCIDMISQSSIDF